MNIERLSELRAAVETVHKKDELLREAEALLSDVLSWHADPDSSDYNQCDTQPCLWCAAAKSWLERMKEKK